MVLKKLKEEAKRMPGKPSGRGLSGKIKIRKRELPATLNQRGSGSSQIRIIMIPPESRYRQNSPEYQIFKNSC